MISENRKRIEKKQHTHARPNEIGSKAVRTRQTQEGFIEL